MQTTSKPEDSFQKLRPFLFCLCAFTIVLITHYGQKTTIGHLSWIDRQQNIIHVHFKTCFSSPGNGGLIQGCHRACVVKLHRGCGVISQTCGARTSGMTNKSVPYSRAVIRALRVCAKQMVVIINSFSSPGASGSHVEQKI